MGRWDYVVVGGGSSGCIVAAELSRDPDVSVVLLEAGDRAEDNPETLRADGYKDAFINDALMWERFSVRQEACGHRHLFMGSGRGMGGSGSINGMVYTRGAAGDYDEWPEGWRWNDIAPDFGEVEATLRVRPREPTEFTETCIAAAEASGFRRSQDLNDGDLSGVLGYEHMNYEGEDRRSSYVAFLREAQERPNLQVLSGARARRLCFDASRRVTAVEYEQGGTVHQAEVGREAVLCAGALESPRLLMLSGVGPGAELRAHGIAEVLELPGVGNNLHDHPNVSVFFRGRRDVDCNYPQLYGFHRANPEVPLPTSRPDTCYVFYPARSSFREGLLRLVPAIFLPPRIYQGAPVVPAAVRGAIRLGFATPWLRSFVRRMYGIVVILGKPRSRGTLRLASADSSKPARIDPRYFAAPEDMDTMVAGVQLARRIAGSGPLSAWGNRELIPGARHTSRRAIEAFIRKNVMTTYHYAGTCRMGSGPEAVVDPTLRVHGLTGVRVADASVIPTTPVAALNAPSMLIGYRASRFMRNGSRDRA